MKLVVLAGQSNMAGRGYAGPDDLAPVPGVKHFARDNSWREAIEPITKDRPFVGTFAADGTKRVSPDPWDAVPPGAGDRVVGVGPGAHVRTSAPGVLSGRGNRARPGGGRRHSRFGMASGRGRSA